jgi:hypothetical protein
MHVIEKIKKSQININKSSLDIFMHLIYFWSAEWCDIFLKYAEWYDIHLKK